MIINEIFKRLFSEPVTNQFPAKYLPKTITGFLDKAGSGKVEMHPPVSLPPRYRGTIIYDAEKCRGCKICLKVCP